MSLNGHGPPPPVDPEQFELACLMIDFLIVATEAIEPHRLSAYSTEGLEVIKRWVEWRTPIIKDMNDGRHG